MNLNEDSVDDSQKKYNKNEYATLPITLCDVLLGDYFNSFQPYLKMSDLLNLGLISRSYNNALREEIKNNFGCGLGLAHFHYNVMNRTLETESHTMTKNISCAHNPCNKCIKICHFPSCSYQSCVLCLPTLFQGCSSPTCLNANTYYCVSCSTNEEYNIFTDTCDVVGCSRWYHTFHENKCDSWMGNSCPDCSRKFCHVHRNPKRYVDNICNKCHRKACVTCWSNLQCFKCPET